jgi:hypothetical protein
MIDRDAEAGLLTPENIGELMMVRSVRPYWRFRAEQKGRICPGRGRDGSSFTAAGHVKNIQRQFLGIAQSFVRSSARLKESRCAEARNRRTACQRSLRVTERDPNKPEQTVNHHRPWFQQCP